MSSKRTRSRLYWALVNALSDDEIAKDVTRTLELFYVSALVTAETDTSLMTNRLVQNALSIVESKHGPGGVLQTLKDRPAWVRQHVDQMTTEYREKADLVTQ